MKKSHNALRLMSAQLARDEALAMVEADPQPRVGASAVVVARHEAGPAPDPQREHQGHGTGVGDVQDRQLVAPEQPDAHGDGRDQAAVPDQAPVPDLEDQELVVAEEVVVQEGEEEPRADDPGDEQPEAPVEDLVRGQVEARRLARQEIHAGQERQDDDDAERVDRDRQVRLHHRAQEQMQTDEDRAGAEDGDGPTGAVAQLERDPAEEADGADHHLEHDDLAGHRGDVGDLAEDREHRR
jgi:hypothetical protein